MPLSVSQTQEELELLTNIKLLKVIKLELVKYKKLLEDIRSNLDYNIIQAESEDNASKIIKRMNDALKVTNHKLNIVKMYSKNHLDEFNKLKTEIESLLKKASSQDHTEEFTKLETEIESLLTIEFTKLETQIGALLVNARTLQKKAKQPFFVFPKQLSEERSNGRSDEKSDENMDANDNTRKNSISFRFQHLSSNSASLSSSSASLSSKVICQNPKRNQRREYDNLLKTLREKEIPNEDEINEQLTFLLDHVEKLKKSAKEEDIKNLIKVLSHTQIMLEKPSPANISSYQKIAEEMQTQPSLGMKILGGLMVALGAAIVACSFALISIGVGIASLPIGASIAAIGVGFFCSKNPTPLSNTMDNLALAQKEANKEFLNVNMDVPF
jgi:hypothetical protein